MTTRRHEMSRQSMGFSIFTYLERNGTDQEPPALD